MTTTLTKLATGIVSDYLTSDELSQWIRVSPSTLCRWRKTGQGPRCTWLSPTCPRYLRADVEAWLRRAAA